VNDSHDQDERVRETAGPERAVPPMEAPQDPAGGLAEKVTNERENAPRLAGAPPCSRRLARRVGVAHD
jgi:hypothetical protein